MFPKVLAASGVGSCFTVGVASGVFSGFAVGVVTGVAVGFAVGFVAGFVAGFLSSLSLESTGFSCSSIITSSVPPATVSSVLSVSTIASLPI